MVHAPSGFQAGQHDLDVEPPARNDDRGNHEGDGMATALGGGFFAGAVQKKLGLTATRTAFVIATIFRPAGRVGDGGLHRRRGGGPRGRRGTNINAATGATGCGGASSKVAAAMASRCWRCNSGEVQYLPGSLRNISANRSTFVGRPGARSRRDRSRARPAARSAGVRALRAPAPEGPGRANRRPGSSARAILATSSSGLGAASTAAVPCSAITS